MAAVVVVVVVVWVVVADLAAGWAGVVVEDVCVEDLVVSVDACSVLHPARMTHTMTGNVAPVRRERNFRIF